MNGKIYLSNLILQNFVTQLQKPALRGLDRHIFLKFLKL